jgi:hypothetical protein
VEGSKRCNILFMNLRDAGKSPTQACCPDEFSRKLDLYNKNIYNFW